MTAGFLAAGVLLDLDHWLDYFLNRGIRLNVREMFHLLCNNLTPRVYIFFHSYELGAAIWIAAIVRGGDLLWGVALGFSLHIILDRWMNPVRPFAFFLLYRIAVKFESRRIRSPGCEGKPIPPLREKLKRSIGKGPLP